MYGDEGGGVGRQKRKWPDEIGRGPDAARLGQGGLWIGGVFVLVVGAVRLDRAGCNAVHADAVGTKFSG